MPARTLEAQVRHQPRVAIVDLHGEINGFAEDVLNAAYADAESRGQRKFCSISAMWIISTAPVLPSS